MSGSSAPPGLASLELHLMDNERGPFLSNPFVARAARWGLLAWSLIGLLILLFVTYRFVLYPIRIIFPPLVVALIVIYLLNPLVAALCSRGIPRIWATLIVYLVFLGIVGLALAYLISAVSHQVTEFVKGVPALLTKAQADLSRALARLGVHVDTNALVKSLSPSGSGASFVGRITSFTSGVVHVALVLVLGPLLAFYLLVDLPKIQRGAEALIPASRRAEMRDLAQRVGGTLGGFFRGQLLVALAVGVTTMLGFYIVGMPFFALLGAVTGLFALVPLIGTVIAAIPMLFVALTASGHTGGLLHIRGGGWLALAGGIVLILVQQLDTRLLSPQLLGRASRLNPVTVLLSLLIGGTLLGLWGMLLAVPTVAALKVIALHLWDTRSAWPPRDSRPPVRPGPSRLRPRPASTVAPAAPAGEVVEREEQEDPMPRIPAGGAGP
jgi:predicted PurR-regulated permease PerM